METWLLLTAYGSALALYPIDRRSSTTHRLAIILQDWHIIMRFDPLKSSKVNDFRVI